jgi:dihydroorotase
MMILIKNCYILAPHYNKIGDIFINHGIIAHIGDDIIVAGAKVIDAKGLIACPGLIDMHVHLREPGYEYKEDIKSGCLAAAAGGVTSVAAMPNTNPACDNPETIEFIINKAKDAAIRVYPVAAITTGQQGGNICNFLELYKAGAIAISDDGRPVMSAQIMREAICEGERLELTVISHCEDTSISEGGLVNEGSASKILGVKGMPNAAEDVMVAREIALAACENKPIHLAHISTKGAVQLIRDAKKRGVKVTAETCPHYFSLTEEMTLSQDADYRMNPPLRTNADVEAVTLGLVDGTIDVIVTDHAPHSAEDKADFFKAQSGVVGLETSLAVGNTYLVKKGKLTFEQLINKMSTVPAKILNIAGGIIGMGENADITLFDPNEKWIVDPQMLHSKSHNTPFKGIELIGKVKLTICRGEIVFDELAIISSEK